MPHATGDLLLRLGTRGSVLALAQSRLVARSLEQAYPGLRVELVVVRTSGDEIADRPLHELGGKGLFTREIEQALLAGSVDLAVHSFKDLPVTMPLVDQSELIVAAVPPREDPRDALVSSAISRLIDLPDSARIGTGSLRRRCQLLSIRPDLEILPIRGNIDTRLRKLRAGEFDALVLAIAGLKRSGLFDAAVVHPMEEMLPAPGQGALALQCRRDDRRTQQLLAGVHDPRTATCVTAERELVRLLEGDCHSPIAALAEHTSQGLKLVARVGARDGRPPVICAEAIGPAEHPEALSRRVFEQLAAQNAHTLLHR